MDESVGNICKNEEGSTCTCEEKAASNCSGGIREDSSCKKCEGSVKENTESVEDQETDKKDGVDEKNLTEEQKQEFKMQCLELKEKGNDLFRNGDYEEAITVYTQALGKCLSTFHKDKSILFSNRAACHMKMGEHEQSICDCTSALELDEMYIKARLRRAQSYESSDKLDEAFEDYKKVLEQDRSNTTAGQACMRLPDQIKERNEKLKEEMMGKLKDLGNMVLKPFGLSTDNFNLQQDPNTGGYSINFQK